MLFNYSWPHFSPIAQSMYLYITCLSIVKFLYHNVDYVIALENTAVLYSLLIIITTCLPNLPFSLWCSSKRKNENNINLNCLIKHGIKKLRGNKNNTQCRAFNRKGFVSNNNFLNIWTSAMHKDTSDIQIKSLI